MAAPVRPSRPGPHVAAEAPGGQRPERRSASRRLPHLTFLLLATAVLVASSLLDVQGVDRVVVRGCGLTVPAACQFRQHTGLPCPGCGLTRAWTHVAHGRVRTAWSCHPIGTLAFALVVFQIPYRLQQLWRLQRGRPTHRFVAADRWVLAGLVVGTAVQWACRALHI